MIARSEKAIYPDLAFYRDLEKLLWHWRVARSNLIPTLNYCCNKNPAGKAASRLIGSPVMGWWKFRKRACRKYPPSPGRPGRFSRGWPDKPYKKIGGRPDLQLQKPPQLLRFNLAEAFCGAGPCSADGTEYGLVWALWQDTARWHRGPRWLSHTSPAPVPPAPGPGT
jgi:hypothetical protein